MLGSNPWMDVESPPSLLVFGPVLPAILVTFATFVAVAATLALSSSPVTDDDVFPSFLDAKLLGLCVDTEEPSDASLLVPSLFEDEDGEDDEDADNEVG